MSEKFLMISKLGPANFGLCSKYMCIKRKSFNVIDLEYSNDKNYLTKID